MLIQIIDSVAHTAHAAAGQAGMHHSMGPYSLAAAVFPYIAVGFLYAKRAILRRRYRRMAEELERTGRLPEKYA